jgi:hypothetical protein
LPGSTVSGVNSWTVTLTAYEASGNTQECAFTVNTIDNTPPVLICPGNQVANATTPSGAMVSYPAAKASDNCDSMSVTFHYSQNSGTLFAIGDTTVTVTAADPSGNAASPCAFNVHVKGALEQINDLITKVNSLTAVNAATRNALVVKLQAALSAAKSGRTATACECMTDFINLAKAQKDKKLVPATVADDLIADATRIKAVLGFPLNKRSSNTQFGQRKP